MRGTIGIACALVLGAAALTACARPAPPPEPVVEDAGGGLLRLASTGATASVAVERGLNHATQYCATRNGMIAVEGTQIEPRGYQLRFRCLETGTPGVTAGAVPGNVTSSPVSGAAPLPVAPVAVSAVTGAPLGPPVAAAPVHAAPAAQAAPADPVPAVARTGLVLPGAARALPPIAAGAAPAPRPAGAPAASPQPPSGFWQLGR